MSFSKSSSKVRVLLLWNGFQPGIAQSVQGFFISQGYEVVSVQHPLFDTDNYRKVTIFKNGLASEIIKHKKSKKMIGYMRDPTWPLHLPDADIAIGFSCHLTNRLLRLRRKQKISTVIHWNIDYVPKGKRFKNSLLDFSYRKLDKRAVRRSNFHVDLTERALTERLQNYRLNRTDKDLVIPVGLNLMGFSPATREKYLQKRLCFIGNLESRLGTGVLIGAVAQLKNKGIDVILDLIGNGSDLDNLKILSSTLGVENQVIFHGELDPIGYMPIIKGAAVACAPYLDDPHSFSVYADPSKIKNYIEGGTPIVLSDVPEIAQKLANTGAALLAKPDSDSFAVAIEELLQNEERWFSAAAAVEEFAQLCDWSSVLQPLLDIIEGSRKLQV